MVVSFAVQKLFSLIRSHLSIFAFIAIAFWVFVMKYLPIPMSRMVLPRLSSKVFIVLGFTFKSLIHLELAFVHGTRKWSSFSVLHMALLVFVSFFKDQMVVVVQHYFWTLYSVPLVYVSVFIPVPCCFGYCSPVV